MIRKRVFVSGIITLLFLVLTNNFWLTKKPVDLQFELSGVNNVSITYQLNGDLFSTVKVSKDFDLKNSPKIKLDNAGLTMFNKAKILVNSGFTGGVTL